MLVEPGEFTDRIGARFVKIPGRDHCIGRCTVTQKEWTAVMGTEPWKGEEYVKEGDDFPATFISWHDSCEFVEKLNEMEDGEMYRLPAEEEWYHACEAGKAGTYFFGDDVSLLGQYAWYIGNTYNVGKRYAHRVGRKKPNRWGLHDMHGNIWEWCEDLKEDPRYRVVRGGSWGCYPEYCEMTARGGNTPGKRFNNLGLRPVRMLD